MNSIFSLFASFVVNLYRVVWMEAHSLWQEKQRSKFEFSSKYPSVINTKLQIAQTAYCVVGTAVFKKSAPIYRELLKARIALPNNSSQAPLITNVLIEYTIGQQFTFAMGHPVPIVLNSKVGILYKYNAFDKKHKEGYYYQQINKTWMKLISTKQTNHFFQFRLSLFSLNF